MRLNWEKYESFSVQKVGLFLMEREGEDPLYTYQEADYKNMWGVQEAIEVSWEVRGFYHSGSSGTAEYPVWEPICNCADIVRADLVLSALAEKHRKMFSSRYN